MTTRSFGGLPITWVLTGLVLAYTVIEAIYLPPAAVVVENRGTSRADVIASWRSRQLVISLRPGTTSRLTIDDETGIQFIARHADGRTYSAEPTYITESMRFVVTVDEGGIAVTGGFH